jgi:hypothetical protein
MHPGWMAGWSGRRKKKRGGVSCNHFHLFTSFIPLSVSYVRGTHTPGMAHSAGWGRRISFVWASTQGRQPVSFVNKSTYLFGVNGRVNENKLINQSINQERRAEAAACPTAWSSIMDRSKHFQHSILVQRLMSISCWVFCYTNN